MCKCVCWSNKCALTVEIEGRRCRFSTSSSCSVCRPCRWRFASESNATLNANEMLDKAVRGHLSEEEVKMLISGLVTAANGKHIIRSALYAIGTPEQWAVWDTWEEMQCVNSWRTMSDPVAERWNELEKTIDVENLGKSLSLSPSSIALLPCESPPSLRSPLRRCCFTTATSSTKRRLGARRYAFLFRNSLHLADYSPRPDLVGSGSRWVVARFDGESHTEKLASS